MSGTADPQVEYCNVHDGKSAGVIMLGQAVAPSPHEPFTAMIGVFQQLPNDIAEEVRSLHSSQESLLGKSTLQRAGTGLAPAAWVLHGNGLAGGLGRKHVRIWMAAAAGGARPAGRRRQQGDGSKTDHSWAPHL